MKKNILKREDILHVAKLAKLKLSDEEIDTYLKQLSSVVDYISKLNEINTDKVEPVSHITGLTNVTAEDNIENKRQLSQKEALQNAKSTKNGFIKVKAIFTQE